MEKTLEQAVALAGNPPPLPAPPVAGAPTEPSSRPIDILIRGPLRGGASGGVVAVDISIGLAASHTVVSRGGNRPDEVCPTRTVDLAYERKFRCAPTYFAAGLRFIPAVWSTNGRAHDEADRLLKDVARTYAVARGVSFHVALRQLRERISIALHRANGDALGRAVEARLRSLAADDALTRGAGAGGRGSVAVGDDALDADDETVREGEVFEMRDAG